jgi:hypothetical protein
MEMIMPDAAPASAGTTNSSGTCKRVILKVWQLNGLICDNAQEIDFLQNSGWTVTCTEKLSEDCAAGTCEVLYLLTNQNPTALPAPTVTAPGPISVTGGSTVYLSLSMTRGRMILRVMDDPNSVDVDINSSATAMFPAPAAGFQEVTVVPPGGANSFRYLALFCINDSAPVDGFQQATWATVHVEACSVTPGKAPVVIPVISNDQLPGGQTRAYYLQINGT